MNKKNKKNKNITEHKERNGKYIFIKFKKSSTLKKSKRMKTSILNFGRFRKKMFWQIFLGDIIIMIFPHYGKVNKL